MKLSTQFTRGDTIRLALELKTGTITSQNVASVTARLKKMTSPNLMPRSTDPVAALFDVTAYADGKGWFLSIPAGVSEGLSAGWYVASASLQFAAGDIQKTTPVHIWIEESV